MELGVCCILFDATCVCQGYSSISWSFLELVAKPHADECTGAQKDVSSSRRPVPGCPQLAFIAHGMPIYRVRAVNSTGVTGVSGLTDTMHSAQRSYAKSFLGDVSNHGRLLS